MEEKIFICISCYYKGYDFIDEIKKLGNKVILITSEKIRDKNWPWHAIDEVYYMREEAPSIWNLDHLLDGISYLLQKHKIDAVIALDDYDVEKAALVRETFRISGMGQTTHRYFRDKLAMRQMAREKALDAPSFTAIFNDETVNSFADRHPAPWVLKPRSEASATGIIKIHSKEELWAAIHKLANKRYHYLLETFEPGDVFHVDSLVFEREIKFTSVSQYLSPPMEVSHEGGVFRTKTLGKSTPEYIALKAANEKILKNFGLAYGATHTEFIRGKKDGKWYFLETSSRVGGAHIPDLVEAATGVNLWREWAKIENAVLKGLPYVPLVASNLSAGLIIALAKEQKPDHTVFECEEAVKFLPLDYHVGVVYQALSAEKIQEKLDEGAEIIYRNFLNIIPPASKLSN